MNSDPGLNPAAEMDGSGAGVSGVTSEGCLVRSEEESLHVAEPSSMEWTNEKHSLYLNSIEASFVDQLYSHGGQSKSMLAWLSRTHKPLVPGSSQSNSCSRVPSSQFKVLHKGCWKKLDFERDRSCLDQRNENQLLAENPWVQHFMSSSAVRGSDVGSCNHLEKEMSGQNFEQKDSGDSGGGEKLSSTRRKRRLKHSDSANAFSRDQVVPHGRHPKMASCSENDSMKKNHGECPRMKPEKNIDFMGIE